MRKPATNQPQRIIFPWQSQKWTDIKSKIVENKITSIPDMDTRISSMYAGKIRSRQITEIFNSYYSDSQYAVDRIPQQDFVNKIIPFMQKLIGDAPKIFRGVEIPAMVPGIPTNITFTRPQVATIIACLWFGLFNNYTYVSRGEYKLDQFPDATFAFLFSGQNIFALQCIINYFVRVYHYMNNEDENVRDLFAAGNIIIKRSVVQPGFDWGSSAAPITEIAIGEGFSDDAPCKMHVAFAHEFIGGMELFKETTCQETVIILTRPETIVASLICGRLACNESITILGAEKMTLHTGYGSSARFAGNYEDPSGYGYAKEDTEVMRQCATIFIDASPRTSGKAQFIDDFVRDIEKAYCGFSSLRFKKVEDIATGNWGYGFNGNNVQIKFIQQVIAASQAGVNLIYYPFGREFEDRVVQFIDWLVRSQVTVGELFQIYQELINDCYSGPNSRLSDLDIFDCLMNGY